VVVAKVIGEIVSSVKVNRLAGQKFLLVEIQKIAGDQNGKKKSFLPVRR